MTASIRISSLALLAVLFAAGAASATPFDTLQSIAGGYNVFLSGNLGTSASPYAADMQGAVAVGGSAYLNNVGVDTNGGGSAALIVGGTLSQTGGSDNGNVFVGGAAANLSGGVTINGSLSLTGANSSLNAASNGGSSPGHVYVTASTQVHDPSYWNSPQVGGGPAAPLDLFGSETDLVNASMASAPTGRRAFHPRAARSISR